MNVKPKRRKCRSCNDFFIPDFRNQDRQCYCSKPECRQASKRASQERWLRQPANRDYFRGSENVQRVRDWRQAHPGYWKKTSPSGKAQVPDSQQVNPKQVSCNVPPSPLGTLQDFCLAKDPGFIGLVAMITGSYVARGHRRHHPSGCRTGAKYSGAERCPEQRNCRVLLMISKHLLRADRQRQIPPSFSWVDHRLIRHVI